jgi:hypothetical protein
MALANMREGVDIETELQKYYQKGRSVDGR